MHSGHGWAASGSVTNANTLPMCSDAWDHAMTELACADDTAPPKSKAQWLATFYLCIPTGYAAGYLAGRYTLGGLMPHAP